MYHFLKLFMNKSWTSSSWIIHELQLYDKNLLSLSAKYENFFFSYLRDPGGPYIELRVTNYITERSVRWYYDLSIAVAAAASAAAASAAAASAAARRPWRREHSNSKNIQPISFKFDMRVDTPPPPPRGTLLLKFDTLRRLEQLCSQPNDTCIPQIFKMQYFQK